MKYKPHADPLPCNVVKLTLSVSGRQAYATGFLASFPAHESAAGDERPNERHRGPFLITTFHSLSGGVSSVDRFARGATPLPVIVDISHGDTCVARFPNYLDGKSTFLVSPDMDDGYYPDIAVIPVPELKRFLPAEDQETSLASSFWILGGIGSANACEADTSVFTFVDDMFLPLGREALIVGFPGGRDFNEAPICLNCAIASVVNHSGEPFFLVSGQFFGGCSGAPILARDFGGYYQQYGPHVLHALQGTPVVDQWLGIYSGRLREIPDRQGFASETPVGVVWKRRCIERVITAGVHDELH